MSLDFHKTVAQLDGITAQLRDRRQAQGRALDEALVQFKGADSTALETRRRAARSTWLTAGLEDDLVGAHPAGPLPSDYAVVSVDGSHIDVDRHAPMHTSLINIGQVLLRYGEQAEAQLWSTPLLTADDAELALRDPESGLREQPLEGPLLGIKRTVMEVEALANLVEQVPAGLPVLALLDGSLVLWGLTGQAYPEFVRQELLEGGLLPALDRLREQAERRTLAVASYVSLPRSTDVVNILRLHACPYDPVDCDRHCRTVQPGQRPCDSVAGITDRHLFGRVLAPYQRSGLFRSESSVVGRYGPHHVLFCYLHAGQELARVEMPAWTATNRDVLDFAHAALLAQVEKGLGYPVALSEAHEQAVVTSQDRHHFELLIEEALAAADQPSATSEKARSKRTRYI
jgi:hypothetical protein